MSERRLTSRDIAEIVKMRGLGYKQSEIARCLGVSQAAIQYQLARINARARREGNDDVFLSIMASDPNVGAGVLFLKLLERN